MPIQRFRAEPFFSPEEEELRYLPEGPRLLQNGPGLGWAAIQHGADSLCGSVNVIDLETRQNRSFPVPGRPGFFAETTRRGLILVGLERSLVYFDFLTGAVVETVAQVTADERVIVNDGLAVEGGVIFGTKHLGCTQPFGALYFFDSATREVHTLAGGQYCSNGKILRGTTLFDIDSTPRTITRYTLDAGLSRVLEKSVVGTAGRLGFPDGMRPVDDESGVVAFFNPDAAPDGVAQQLRLSDGAVLCEWLIPDSPRVTCPEFVEIGGQVKIVFTTADENMPEAARRLAPGAGTMYLADTPFVSMPPSPPLLRV